MSPNTTPMAPSTRPAVAPRCADARVIGRTVAAVVSLMFWSPASTRALAGRIGRGLYAPLLRRTMTPAGTRRRRLGGDTLRGVHGHRYRGASISCSSARRRVLGARARRRAEDADPEQDHRPDHDVGLGDAQRGREPGEPRDEHDEADQVEQERHESLLVANASDRLAPVGRGVPGVGSGPVRYARYGTFPTGCGNPARASRGTRRTPRARRARRACGGTVRPRRRAAPRWRRDGPV